MFECVCSFREGALDVASAVEMEATLGQPSDFGVDNDDGVV